RSLHSVCKSDCPAGGIGLGSSIANAAARLNVDCVIVGTSQRTAIWHLLRGNVLKELVKVLPEQTRLLIVN
ncbi:MAG: hypothetical protein EBZ75_12745, partial [Oxalobacteraceae bacterium]|nr:hypothetical protein [Oxalobacteraceae bacterium]